MAIRKGKYSRNREAKYITIRGLLGDPNFFWKPILNWEVDDATLFLLSASSSLFVFTNDWVTAASSTNWNPGFLTFAFAASSEYALAENRAAVLAGPSIPDKLLTLFPLSTLGFVFSILLAIHHIVLSLKL